MTARARAACGSSLGRWADERGSTYAKRQQRLMKNVDSSPVIAVYRRGGVVPLLAATAVVALLLISVGVDSPGVAPFALVVWILFGISVLTWRRQAAIFTSDSLWVRPCLGHTLKIPLKGVKRAYIHPGLTHEDGPTVRVELLIGGEITIAVPDMEAVVHLLNKGAGKGLDAAQHAAAADR